MIWLTVLVIAVGGATSRPVLADETRVPVVLAKTNASIDHSDSSACADCHEDEVNGFPDSPHGKVFGRSLQQEAKGGGCDSCHGPGDAHIESDGVASDILGFGVDSDPARTTAVCLSCHTKDATQMHWDGSAHQSASVACTSCHAAHHGVTDKPLVRATVTETCLTCHADQKRGLLMRSRHPLREGKMDCTSCHSPHGSPGPSLLASHDVFETCTKCHAELRGPFLWEHAPVRESCLNCHAPHGSNHEKLLVTTNFRLCQSCHIQGRHQTVAGNDERFFMTNRACTNCHAQVHGSNHPSGPILQR